MSRSCSKCGTEEGIQEHHVIPRAIGGRDVDGRILLCEKCHLLLHEAIRKFVGDWILPGTSVMFIRDECGSISHEEIPKMTSPRKPGCCPAGHLCSEVNGIFIKCHLCDWIDDSTFADIQKVFKPCPQS